MAISKPITRVEQYLAHISGMRVNVPEVPLTREEMYLAAWARKSGIEDTEMQGEPPLTLKDCIGEPFNGLVLYGKSTQVTTTGAQLLNLVDREPVTICGLTWQIKNQCISVNGTATDEENVTDFYICGTRGVYADVDFPEGRITISADLPKDIIMYVVKNGGTTLTYIASDKKDGSFEHVSGSKYRILLRARKKGAIYDNVIKAMFNRGDTALLWEPYTGGKPSPSPDYPQEIQSAGDDGNVAINVTGKNLLDISKANVSSLETSLGCNIMPKSGCIKIFGNTTRESYISFSPDIIPIGKKVFLLLKTEGSSRVRLRIAYQKESEKKVSYIYSGDEFLRENTSYKVLTIQLIIMSGELDDEVYPMITTEKDTTFEPYKGEQLLTLLTPNGLPGIPVSSGGNYTDDNGQRWICDEVDLGRGVYVQRIGVLTLDDKSTIRSVSKWDNKHLDVVQPYRVDGVTMSRKKVICNRLPSEEMREAWGRDIEMIGGVGATNKLDFYIKNQRLGTTKDTSPDDAISAALKWLKENPLSCKYALATSIETPLSETDIAAYRALTTYKGTTILESECYLKVKYSKLRK